MKRAEYIDFGRIPDLLTRPNADRIALKHGRGIFDRTKVVTFPSRGAMLAFMNTNPESGLRALVKDRVASSMLVNRSFQEVA